MKQRTFPETHRTGHVSIENLEMIQQMDLLHADFGIQIASNGQAWICVNGVAFVRFKPKLEEDAIGSRKVD